LPSRLISTLTISSFAAALAIVNNFGARTRVAGRMFSAASKPGLMVSDTRGELVSTPIRGLRNGRRLEAGRSTPSVDPAAEPAQRVTPVPIHGLVGPEQRGAAGYRATRDRATTVRRMSFSKTQLADASSVNGIAALAKHTGVIDTKKLTAADRVSLLRVLKADTQFTTKHRPLLMELADEVRADLGATKPPAASAAAPVALTYSSVDVTQDSETFDSQSEADKSWAVRAKSAGVTSHQVMGNFPEPTRLSLDYGLYRFTCAERLGTELRLMIPVRVGAASPKLPVLMSWDATGAATIRVAGKSAPRPPTTHSPDAFVKYLAGKGVTVADVRSWTAQQLQEFVVAVQLIDKLDPKAVRALEGIVLEYTTKADTSRDPQEAVFGWHPQNKTKTTLLVRKQAFSEDATQFVGSPGEKLHCHSTMTLAHELGHAVEAHHYRHVSHAQAKAVDAQAAAFADFERANDDYVRKTQGANAAILKSYESARVAAVKNALVSLYEVAENGINAAVDGLDLVTDHGQRPALPKAEIDSAKQLLISAAQSLAEEARNNPTLSAHWKPLLIELTAGQKRLAPILDALNSAAESVRKTNAALETVVHREGKEIRSKRLQNFIIFVDRLSPDARERVIGITPYARKEWHTKPGELFAEAYALWLTDRTFLTRVAPEFVAYFGQGKHLK